VNLVDKVYSWNSNEGILKNNTWYGEEARMINGTGDHGWGRKFMLENGMLNLTH
jgi:hypothetical protein